MEEIPLLRRFLALLIPLALLLCLPAVYALAEEDEPAFVAPTLPPNAIPYDKEHPELLDEDMIYATSCILIEASTGEVIFEKNADMIMYPASTTKILTAYIALQMGDLTGDVVTISQEAIDLVPSGYQKIPLSAGEEVNLLDLISIMLIKSGNEAANAIAEYMCGSIPAFADMMNDTAQMLGCSQDTHFTNPTGLQEPTHYTTARDMAIITRAAMQDPRFRDIVCRTTYEMPPTNKRPERTIIGNTPILNPESTTYYYPDAVGVKTGFTNDAGYCFVGAAKRGGVELISVVFYSGDTRRYLDTIKLFDYGFTQVEAISPESLYAEDPRIIEVTGFSMEDSNRGQLPLGIRALDESKDMTIIGRTEKINMLRENFGQVSSIEWTRSFRAPIMVGEVMGILTFYAENGETAQYELVATRTVEARENAPLSLEEIEAYTLADENPFPRFSWDLLVPPALMLLAIVMFVRFLLKHRKKRYKAPDIKPVKKKYLR